MPSCCVCMEEYQINGIKRPMALGCGHSLCGECFRNMPEFLCPICRSPLKEEAPYHSEMVEMLRTISILKARCARTQIEIDESRDTTELLLLSVENYQQSFNDWPRNMEGPGRPKEINDKKSSVSQRGITYIH